MAEESTELALACMKMARKLRDENPTFLQIEDIHDDLIEALSMLKALEYLLSEETDILDYEELHDRTVKKYRSWKSIGLHLDLDD
jgi:hypothetical protein